MTERRASRCKGRRQEPACEFRDRREAHEREEIQQMGGGGVSHFYGFTALSSVLGHCWQGRDHGDKEAGHAGGRPP